MRKERVNELYLKHSRKEKELLQNKALSKFQEGQLLKDLQDNQIFKFDSERDYYKVATYPERFSVHKADKIKVRFR